MAWAQPRSPDPGLQHSRECNDTNTTTRTPAALFRVQLQKRRYAKAALWRVRLQERLVLPVRRGRTLRAQPTCRCARLLSRILPDARFRRCPLQKMPTSVCPPRRRSSVGCSSSREQELHTITSRTLNLAVFQTASSSMSKKLIEARNAQRASVLRTNRGQRGGTLTELPQPSWAACPTRAVGCSHQPDTPRLGREFAQLNVMPGRAVRIAF